MITLLTWSEPEADLSLTWNNIEVICNVYCDTDIEAVTSLRPWNIVDLTETKMHSFLRHNRQASKQVAYS